MVKYQITFQDETHGTFVTCFESFDEAIEYWNEYADTDTCIAGEFKDLETHEVLWSFDDNKLPCDGINDL